MGYGILRSDKTVYRTLRSLAFGIAENNEITGTTIILN